MLWLCNGYNNVASVLKIKNLEHYFKTKSMIKMLNVADKKVVHKTNPATTTPAARQEANHVWVINFLF